MSRRGKYRNLIKNLQNAQDAHASDNLAEAAETIFRACKNTVECQSGYITLLSDTYEIDEVIFIDSDVDNSLVNMKTSNFITGEQAELKLLEDPVYYNAIGESDLNRSWYQSFANIMNILFSPIIYHEQTIGLLCLLNKEGGFDEDDLGIASIFSHVAAIAFNNLSAEVKITKGENKYRNLFNNIPVGLYVTNSMEQIVDMNERMLEILNIKRLEDFEGQDLSSYYLDPRDRIQWQNILENADSIQYLETRFKGPDGSVLWVSETAHLIMGHDGEEYCEVMIEDITTRKRSEEAFTKTYLQLDSAHKELNERARWMESLNNFLFELAGERTEDSIFNTVLSNLAKVFSINFAGFGKFNEELKSITLTAVKNMHTEQDTLLLRECPLKKEDLSVLNSSTRNIVKIDGDSEIYKLLDTNFTKLLYDLSKNGRDSIILIPVRYEKTMYGNIIVVSPKCELSDNQKYFLENMAEYLSLAVENLYLYERLSSSYKKLESAQDAMKKNERIKAMGQIASGITHDINNTLSPITLYTEALIETEENLSERASRYLKTIQNAVSDIEHVTQRLRTFYKQDEELKTEYIFISDIFDEIIELTRPKWEAIPNKEGITFKIEKNITDYKSFISGCRSDIRESLVNCVFNAVDAMPEGGIIRLSERIENDSMRIIIEDEGVGMTEEQLNHCLEPFYTTKGSAGTGLGLAEVYGMMQRHGGDVEIKSSSGGGTRINLIFPPALVTESYENSQNGSRKLSRMKILCVDDDKRILEGLKEIFLLDGHLIKTAGSGIEALTILEQEFRQDDFFDVLITDLGMPGMDGYALAAEVKSLYPNLPIVMLSGWGSQIKKSDYKSEDICCILSKPPSLKALRETLRSISDGGSRT